MPDVGPESIPGSVALPIWVLVAAIVIQAIALGYLVKKLLEIIPTKTSAIALSTRAIEENTEVLRDVQHALEGRP